LWISTSACQRAANTENGVAALPIVCGLAVDGRARSTRDTSQTEVARLDFPTT
jgi:hypothetical protein